MKHALTQPSTRGIPPTVRYVSPLRWIITRPLQYMIDVGALFTSHDPPAPSRLSMMMPPRPAPAYGLVESAGPGEPAGVAG